MNELSVVLLKGGLIQLQKDAITSPLPSPRQFCSGSTVQYKVTSLTVKEINI